MSTNITFECSLIVADLPQVDIGISGQDVMTKENIDLLISWKIFMNTHNTTPTTSASSVGHGASGCVTHEEHAAASHGVSENFSLDNTVYTFIAQRTSPYQLGVKPLFLHSWGKYVKTCMSIWRKNQF